MTGRLRIIVTGLIGQYPLGGVTWDYLQYVLGLHRAGHDVYYLEDTGFWPFNPNEGGLSENGCEFNINYLNKVFQQFGLSERWMFCFTKGEDSVEWFGLTDRKRKEVLATTDLLINVSGCLLDPSAYRQIPRLAYIDSDPVFTQVKIALGYESFRNQILTHDSHFTFAENPRHLMPETGIKWNTTRQPITVEEWAPVIESRSSLTTVMNWTSYEALHYNGIEYGQKDREFEGFLSLPQRFKQEGIPVDLELAVNQGKTTRTPKKRLLDHGWKLVEPNLVCPDIKSYRDYISRSYGEWSVAKGGYVVGRSGWFSCRSACYLAAGRPVIVQDTGFSEVLPVDGGIHAFKTSDDILVAIEKLLSNYNRERQLARDVAVYCFDAQKVLEQLIHQAMRSDPSPQACSPMETIGLASPAAKRVI